MLSVCSALLVLSVVCFGGAFAFSSGAPVIACPTLTQLHPGVDPMPCTNCPFNVSLLAIDGDPPSAASGMYRCGSIHTRKSLLIVY